MPSNCDFTIKKQKQKPGSTYESDQFPWNILGYFFEKLPIHGFQLTLFLRVQSSSMKAQNALWVAYGVIIIGCTLWRFTPWCGGIRDPILLAGYQMHECIYGKSQSCCNSTGMTKAFHKPEDISSTKAWGLAGSMLFNHARHRTAQKVKAGLGFNRLVMQYVWECSLTIWPGQRMVGIFK